MSRFTLYTYVGPPYCRAEMYAGRVACCPLVSHGENVDGLEVQTPDRYITLSDRRGQREKVAVGGVLILFFYSH